jgi:hypothetical protein
MKTSVRRTLIAWAAVGIFHASILPVTAGEAKSLQPIVEALRHEGRNLFMGDDLAGVLGIPVDSGEEGIIMRGEALESGGVIRSMQVPVREEHDYVLFIVQKDNDVWFYLANKAGSLKKALRRDRARKENSGLDMKSAENAFLAEVAYWERELKVGSR